MNARELADSIAKEHDLPRPLCRTIVKDVFETIIDRVAHGERVSLSGFGAFDQAVRKARKARNPKTGEAVEVRRKVVPKFVAARSFKDSV